MNVRDLAAAVDTRDDRTLSDLDEEEQKFVEREACIRERSFELYAARAAAPQVDDLCTSLDYVTYQGHEARLNASQILSYVMSDSPLLASYLRGLMFGIIKAECDQKARAEFDAMDRDPDLTRE
jgi:hypothetical protein